MKTWWLVFDQSVAAEQRDGKIDKIGPRGSCRAPGPAGHVHRRFQGSAKPPPTAADANTRPAVTSPRFGTRY